MIVFSNLAVTIVLPDFIPPQTKPDLMNSFLAIKKTGEEKQYKRRGITLSTRTNHTPVLITQSASALKSIWGLAGIAFGENCAYLPQLSFLQQFSPNTRPPDCGPKKGAHNTFFSQQILKKNNGLEMKEKRKQAQVCSIVGKRGEVRLLFVLQRQGEKAITWVRTISIIFFHPSCHEARYTQDRQWVHHKIEKRQTWMLM